MADPFGMGTPVPEVPITCIACPPVVAFSTQPSGNFPDGKIRLRVAVNETVDVTLKLKAEVSCAVME